MAIQAWDKGLREENEALKQQLMISASPNPGPAPVRPEDIPIAPSSPYEKGKSPHKLARRSSHIRGNEIFVPFIPKDPESDEGYGEGVDEIENTGEGTQATGRNKNMTIAHGEGRGPQPDLHNEYNEPLKIPPWMKMFPDGKVREIPWIKEKYKNEHPDLMISDHRSLTNFLDSKGRSGRTGSFKDSGLPKDKLIEALKIGIQVMKT